MNISEIEEITKTLIQTQIIKALKDAPEYIDDLVKSVINGEVDESGGKPSYSSKTKMPWLEWCARDVIRGATRKASLEMVAEMEPELRASIKKALNSDKIAEAFAIRIISGLNDYSVSVNFKELHKD